MSKQDKNNLNFIVQAQGMTKNAAMQRVLAEAVEDVVEEVSQTKKQKPKGKLGAVRGTALPLPNQNKNAKKDNSNFDPSPPTPYKKPPKKKLTKRERENIWIPKKQSVFGDFGPGAFSKNYFPEGGEKGLKNMRDALLVQQLSANQENNFNENSSLQKESDTDGKPLFNVKPTALGREYDNSNIDKIIHLENGKLSFKNQKDLDYAKWLPIFFDGLREKAHPYRLIAVQGVELMLKNGHPKNGGSFFTEENKVQVHVVIENLITPIKDALHTRDKQIVCTILEELMCLCKYGGKLAGEALTPRMKQFLSVLNELSGKNCNLGDGIEYAQRKRQNLGDQILQTLNMLERNGGDNAFDEIKYMVPTYESCLRPVPRRHM